MELRQTLKLRKAWRNDTGNQHIYPLREVTPTALEELCEVVREAERDGCTVRAVGSGHSSSDVALADGILVHPSGLSKPWGLEEQLLRVPAMETREGEGAQRGR